MANTWTPNEQTLNGTSSESASNWELDAPIEKERLFFLDVGTLRMPISSAQASMRLAGQSYLQVIVPGGDQYIDELTVLQNEQMVLKSGYLYTDGTMSPLEAIAYAPFELLRSDEGTSSFTLTLEGYGTLLAADAETIALKGVQTRTISATGRRRIRCSIDLFLRPGHTAVDDVGVSFTVGVIQYFINSNSESMEVLQDG